MFLTPNCKNRSYGKFSGTVQLLSPLLCFSQDQCLKRFQLCEPLGDFLRPIQHAILEWNFSVHETGQFSIFYAVLRQRHIFCKTSKSRSLLCLSLHSGTCSKICWGKRLSTHLIHSNSQEVFFEGKSFFYHTSNQLNNLSLSVQILHI